MKLIARKNALGDFVAILEWGMVVDTFGYGIFWRERRKFPKNHNFK